MAERLSTLPGAWSVAHYVELRGALDPTLLGKAIVAGLRQADTLSLRFEEEEGKSGSGWRPTAPLANRRSLTCVRRRIRIAPPRSGCRRTLAQDLRVDGEQPAGVPSAARVGDDRWYWYQRYHHLLVDGFSFPAITRQIAAIYRAWQREATPESPFTPSPRWWTSTSATPAARPGSGIKPSGRLSARRYRRLPHSLPRRWADAPPGAMSWRMKLEMNADAFRRLAGHAPQCQPADLALALTTLWLGRLCNRMDYAAGFIFMRRMGSAALASTGPVLNVLPLAVHIDAQETLADRRCASPLS